MGNTPVRLYLLPLMYFSFPSIKFHVASEAEDSVPPEMTSLMNVSSILGPNGGDGIQLVKLMTYRRGAPWVKSSKKFSGSTVLLKTVTMLWKRLEKNKMYLFLK